MTTIEDLDIVVDYENENPSDDWYVKIRIPKQKDWADTQRLANELKQEIIYKIKDCLPELFGKN